jgi:hypothetical protein
MPAAAVNNPTASWRGADAISKFALWWRFYATKPKSLNPGQNKTLTPAISSPVVSVF